ncbi:unnamed protein product [Symbiodinium natans]|uniref:Uncharacterized protein n=1 Tax=Symbiodinium natans TaxID=878477 RepID=A0A812PME5_9DINO|nr:unnamed protein product [Symbiodinium natans]
MFSPFSLHFITLMRVFSARDYEGHGNDGAVLLIKKKNAKEKPGNAEGNADELLIVRPQVLRSVKKQRMEARKHANEGDSSQEMRPERPPTPATRGGVGGEGFPKLGAAPTSPSRGGQKQRAQSSARNRAMSS